MNTPLNELLRYKNSHVFSRYQKDHPDNKLSAEEALAELVKFFWLSYKRKADIKNHPSETFLEFSCVIHQEMHEIDDMWHTFLLFTRDYTDFCHKYFGEYIHHSPNTTGGEPTREVYETELTRYLSYIYDNLGEETVKKWFAETLNESV